MAVALAKDVFEVAWANYMPGSLDFQKSQDRSYSPLTSEARWTAQRLQLSRGALNCSRRSCC